MACVELPACWSDIVMLWLPLSQERVLLLSRLLNHCPSHTQSSKHLTARLRQLKSLLVAMLQFSSVFNSPHRDYCHCPFNWGCAFTWKSISHRLVLILALGPHKHIIRHPWLCIMGLCLSVRQQKLPVKMLSTCTAVVQQSKWGEASWEIHPLSC